MTKSRDNAIIDLETERDAKRELHKAKEDWKAKYEELRRFVVREPEFVEDAPVLTMFRIEVHSL